MKPENAFWPSGSVRWLSEHVPRHGFGDLMPRVYEPADFPASARLIVSVCTGAFILGRVGLLEGRRVTTHWEDIPDLRAAFPDLEVLESVPFVDEGLVVSSAGVSAGIGMSLHLVGRILGTPLARATARQMQYDWEPTGETRSAA